MPADSRKRLPAPRPVQVGQDALIAERLEALRPAYSGNPRKVLPQAQLALLVKHRDRGVAWKQLTSVFGISENTLRRIYEEAKGA